jgi:spore coat protein CotH
MLLVQRWKLLTNIRVSIILSFFFLCILQCLVFAGENANAVSQEYESVLFAKDHILEISINVSTEQWEDMLADARNESYIPCDIVIDGKSVSAVGIRPKGNSSLNTVASDPNTERYSFKVEFDHYIDGQLFYGLDKLVLNNMQADATYMKEYLSYELMTEIGIPTPLYNFARISVNGNLWGFYLAVEAIEDSFVNRVFEDSAGALYKPETLDMAPEQRSAGGSDLLYTDDNLSSYAALFDNTVFTISNEDKVRLIETLKKLSEGEALQECVYLEEVLKYFAVNTFLVNLDSYQSNMSHNYYLYERKGKLMMIPWDYNLSFAGFQVQDTAFAINFPIDTPVSGTTLADRPLLGKLLEEQEYLEKYHEYLAALVTYFENGNFVQRVEEIDRLIRQDVQSDPSAFFSFEEYEVAVSALKKYGMYRAESVSGQLKGIIPATAEEQEADTTTLITGNDLDLTSLGTNSPGGMRGGAPRDFGNFERVDFQPGERVLGENPPARPDVNPEQLQPEQFGGVPPENSIGFPGSRISASSAYLVSGLFCTLFTGIFSAKRYRRRKR